MSKKRSVASKKRGEIHVVVHLKERSGDRIGKVMRLLRQGDELTLAWVERLLILVEAQTKAHELLAAEKLASVRRLVDLDTLASRPSHTRKGRRRRCLSERGVID